MSLIPASLGRNELVDWIPVDLLSSIILELAVDSPNKGDHETGQAKIVHAVNPHKVQWHETVLPVLLSRLTSKSVTGPMKVVSMAEWVESLRSASLVASEEDEAAISAFKLIPFLSALAQGDARPTFETVKTAKLSKGLRELEPVGERWVNSWLDQWGY